MAMQTPRTGQLFTQPYIDHSPCTCCPAHSQLVSKHTLAHATSQVSLAQLTANRGSQKHSLAAGAAAAAAAGSHQRCARTGLVTGQFCSLLLCCVFDGSERYMTCAPLVCVEVLQRLELPTLLAEPAVHPVDLGTHGRQVYCAHLVALVVGFCCT